MRFATHWDASLQPRTALVLERVQTVVSQVRGFERAVLDIIASQVRTHLRHGRPLI